MKKILVTGHKGYIGVHLVDLLKEQGHHVVGCDLDLFEGCEWESFVTADKEYLKDFRELTMDELQGFDSIMHLAAISNDPMGDLDPEITFGINREGTKELAEKAKKAGIPQFLFSSSCSIYGKGDQLDIDEEGATAPLTAYASSKIAAEEHLKKLADRHFQAICLRNATAYGDSPMLRIDLVVNNLLACGLSRGDIRVMSDGSPWRPLVHCRDIARAFVAFLNYSSENPFLIVNVGGNSENYQVRDVVNAVKARLPEASVVFTGEVGADPRNYRVNFDKLARVLPEFKLEYTLEKGVEELHAKFQKYGFGLKDFESEQFVRLRTLKKRLNKITG
ncbi:Nucleoside-diphosphate-sugar epimerase [Chlamydiales bacterium STE3]|nr:Nucleoside-diphosphate-sugar epimerase [Chlamydiales bacterium STE3]